MQRSTQIRAVFFGPPLGVLSPAEPHPSPPARFATGPESCIQRGGSGPWELQLYKAVRQLGQALGWGVGAEGCWERRGSGEVQGRGRPGASSPPLHPHIPKASVLVTGSRKRSVLCGSPTFPDFVCKGNRLGSVAFLYLLVSAKPKNTARGTLRICSQSAGTAAAPALLRFRWSSLRGLQFQHAEGGSRGAL